MRYLMHILLYLSWPVTNIHRFWNNKPINEVDAFLFADQAQDVQWYVYHTGLMLAPLMVVCGVLLFVKYDFSRSAQAFYITMLTLAIAFFLDIVNYWLFAGHDDSMMYVQLGVLFFGGTISYINESNRNGKRKGINRYEPAR